MGKHLRSRGIDTKPPGLHPDDVQLPPSCTSQLESLARIAEKFGTTANTVRLRLLEVGVVMRDEHDESARAKRHSANNDIRPPEAPAALAGSTPYRGRDTPRGLRNQRTGVGERLRVIG